MELFVVLLAIGLSSSEKLNRAYLPPPGAKLAGGSSGDLQTPLEYPEDNPTFGVNDNGYSNFEEHRNVAMDNIFKNHDSVLTGGYKNDHYITTEYSNEYTQTTPYPINSYDTTIPEMVNDAGARNRFGNRYPIKSISIIQEVDKNGYHYGKPENMPIIAATDAILSNYNPNGFGMYGGNPMLIKTELNNMFVILDGSSDYPSNNLYTSDQFGSRSLNQSPVSSIPKSSQRTYPSTFKPVTTVTSVNPFRRKPQRPQAQSDRTAIENHYKNIINPNEYTYSFDTSNGIHMDETASTINGVQASGSYSYTGDDGKLYKMVYTADENGFQPNGDHLPTPPPIPEAIQKVIEQAELDKKAGIYHDGSYDEKKYGHMKYQGPVERYIMNMQVNPKLRNRNKNKDLRKVHKNPVVTFPKEAVNYHGIKEDVLLINEYNRSKHNFNGRFGMKTDISVKKTKANPTNTLDRQNNFKQSLREPITHFDGQSHYNDRGVTSGQDVNLIYKDPGYFYVPPRQIFIEGRPQDKQTVNQYGTISEDFKTKSILESGLYYDDQRNKVDHSSNLFQNTTSDLTTESLESNTQTFAGNYYDSIHKDLNEANNSEGKDSTSTKIVTNLITTSKPRENTQNTNAYDQENTKDYQEDSFSTEQKDENVVNFTGEGFELNNLSTTPMPRENKYPNVLSDSNQYKSFNPSTNKEFGTKYSEDGGYLIKKPDVQVFFEDFPSSTYSPIFTVNDIQTETIPNIKVDGFGRPIQDSQQFKNTHNYGFTESPFEADDMKATATYYNFEEALKNRTVISEDDKINFNFSDQPKVTKNLAEKVNVE